ncbi:hypothetical protein [Cryobacterium sp. N22]|uniref:hypothetical protein n=1 Tax=Cryobacterium sp. N22 TaxID=2048290 RepID=UPI0011B034CD|nr:hypothetical protein [Cryobacterium sp. N22]
MSTTKIATSFATIALAATFAVTGTVAAHAAPALAPERSIVTQAVGLPVKTMAVGTTAGGRMYMQFSQAEQASIKQGGIGAALAAVCTAGPLVCVPGAAIAPAVSVTVATSGVCSGNESMRFYYVYGGGPTGSGIAITSQTCVA